MEAKLRPSFRLVQGRNHSEIWIGSIRIFVAPEEMPPFVVEAVVFEEDTFLILSTDPELHEVAEAAPEVMAEAASLRPATPGSVILRGESPLQMLAVVHDLNEEPSWREEWVESALAEIFRVAEIRRFSSLALPLLGTLHGTMAKDRFLALLQEAVGKHPPVYLKRLWLLVSKGTAAELLTLLKSTAEDR
jgi:hypothetical protein